MQILKKPETLHWTHHSREKMRFYKLSEQRVKRVIHSPKRVEEGIAPKTIAMMQPASVKRDMRHETWNQEIWVMIQRVRHGTRDKRQEIMKVISAWRYPGMTKSRSEIALDFLRREYRDYSSGGKSED